MKLEIDTEAGVLIRDGERLPLYGDASFRALSDLWVKVGWNQKYSYTFSWLGVPIIQLPEDMIRYQEVVARLKPDVIVETGIAHGGSAIFSASLCRLLGKGRVVAVDIEIRPHNRRAIEAHPLADLLALIEGSSTDAATIEAVKAQIRPGESVLVVLDFEPQLRPCDGRTRGLCAAGDAWLLCRRDRRHHARSDRRATRDRRLGTRQSRRSGARLRRGASRIRP